MVIEAAIANGGVIISNDRYKDLTDVSEDFKEVINNRTLKFEFLNDAKGAPDRFWVPNDPRGKNGPTLEQFLTK